MFLLGYLRDAARCKLGKVAVMVLAEDGSNLRRWGGQIWGHPIARILIKTE